MENRVAMSNHKKTHPPPHPCRPTFEVLKYTLSVRGAGRIALDIAVDVIEIGPVPYSNKTKKERHFDHVCTPKKEEKKPPLLETIFISLQNQLFILFSSMFISIPVSILSWRGSSDFIFGISKKPESLLTLYSDHVEALLLNKTLGDLGPLYVVLMCAMSRLCENKRKKGT